jgi:uncharacterized membrane protein YebE (DUF533 family)
MKLINRLDEMFDKLMGKEIFYKDSTIKEIISQIIDKDIDELNSREEVYILLKAMVNAAKADGQIDEFEQKKIMEYMGDMSKVEKMFVEYELKKNFNLPEFLKEIPKGMEQQVYYMSLFTIDLDNSEGREYLEVLAEKLNLTFNVVNNIHESLEAKIA